MATSMWCMSPRSKLHTSIDHEWRSGQRVKHWTAGARTLQEHPLLWAHYSTAYHAHLRADGNVTTNDVDVPLVSRPTEEAMELPPRTGCPYLFFTMTTNFFRLITELCEKILGQQKITTIDTEVLIGVRPRTDHNVFSWKTCHERAQTL